MISPLELCRAPGFRALVLACPGAIVLLFPAAGARAQTVPLVNPGFEDGFTGWTYNTQSSPGPIYVSSDARTGTSSMEFNGQNASIVQETSYVLHAGDDVALSFWVKGPNGTASNGTASMVWIDSTGAIQPITSSNAWHASGWSEKILSFKIPSGAPSIGRHLAVFFGTGAPWIRLDDVSLEVNNQTCIGFPTEYAGSMTNLDQRVYAVPIQLTEVGTLRSIAAFTQGNEQNAIRYAVYADTSSQPGNLIAQTSADALGTLNWHWHAIATPAIALSAGTYWIAISVETPTQSLVSQSGGTAYWYSGNATTSGFSPHWNSAQYDNDSFAVVACYTVGNDPGLVGWWKLDEQSGYIASDSSGHGHDATASQIDPATAWQSAHCGRGLAFNGIDSKATVPDNDDFDNTSQLTVAFWCKPYVLDGNPRGPICKRISWTTQYSWGIFFYGGNHLNVDITSNDDRFASNYTFTENEWVHIAVVFDGTLPQSSRVAVYVNGVLDTTAPESSTSIPNTNSPLVLGQLNGNSAGYFDGILDEVRVYRRALTVNEIANVMKCTAGAPQIVRWREVVK